MANAQKPSILITGCSKGAGNALVREFQSQGYIVFATARRPESLEALSRLPDVHVLAVDVCEISTIQKAREYVAEVTGGKLDVLFNNAAISEAGRAAELDLDEVRRLYETNLFGVMATVKEFVPLLIASRGKIVNMSSVGGLFTVIFGSPYSSSKAALFAYSDALRLELAPFGVQVTAIAGGGIDTPMYKAQEIEIPPDSIYAPAKDSIEASKASQSAAKMMSPEEFAQDVFRQISPTKRLPRWIWAGTGAYAVSWLRVFLPKEWLDYIIGSVFAKRIDWSPITDAKKNA